MLHATKGIVLRTVKYGETSLVVTMYTELFGMQSYLVNGARTEKKSSGKANLFQPGTLLELIVYHQPNKNLQRIKEVKIYYLYQTLHTNIVKNTIGTYLVELISKTITEPESHIELYDFLEKSMLYIDKNAESKLANFPIHFTLQLFLILGFEIQNSFSELRPFLDLMNGQYVSKDKLEHLHYIEGALAEAISNCNKLSFEDVSQVALNNTLRKEIIYALIQYLKFHISSFGELRSIDILHEILS